MFLLNHKAGADNKQRVGLNTTRWDYFINSAKGNNK
jgi:hypothetical protein